MARNPVVRTTHWPSLVPQLLLMAALTAIIHFLLPGLKIHLAIFAAVLLLVFFWRTIRATFNGNFGKGVKAYHANKFEDALGFFKQSHAFFTKHPGLDRWRAIIFGVASHQPYRLISLANQAYCYTQLGQGQKAIELYEQALREDPEYRAAKMALNVLRSVSAPAPPPCS